MLGLYRKIKIRAKIIVSFIFIFVLFLLFILFTLFNSIDLSYKRNTLDTSRICIDKIMSIRLSERNFFITGEPEYAALNRKLIEELKHIFSGLKERESNKRIKVRIDSLNKLINHYSTSFNRMSCYTIIRNAKKISVDEIESIKKNTNGGDFNYKGEKGLKWVLRDDYLVLISLNPGSDDIQKISLLIELYLAEGRAETISSIADLLIKLNDTTEISPESKKIISEMKNAIYSIASLDSMIKGEEAEFNEYIQRLETGVVDYMSYIKKYVEVVGYMSLFLSIVTVVVLILFFILLAIFTVKEITRSIQMIAKSTGAIKDVSKRLSSIVERKTITTMKVSSSIVDIKDVITEQGNVILMSGDAIKRLIRHIATISDISESKKKSFIDMRRSIYTTGEHINEVAVSIVNLKSMYDDMMRMIQLVLDIAGKSRILAVNAGIEASNAGDYGILLRIVAREIKELSSEVALKSKEMGTLINNSMKIIETAAEKSLCITEEFRELSAEIDNNAVTMVDIIERISKINRETTDIKYFLDKLQCTAADVDRNIEVVMSEHSNMRLNIHELQQVKVDTNNAIKDIVENIRKLTDENDTTVPFDSGVV